MLWKTASGVPAGGGKPVHVTPPDLMRRRGREPTRGALDRAFRTSVRAGRDGAGLDAGHRGGDQPHERRPVVGAIPAAAERANTPGAGAERREGRGRRDEVPNESLARAVKL
jgi:hypothetical protein